MIAESVSMRTVDARARRVAKSDLPVLITGPSGAGKEVVARTVHSASDRATRIFLALNCGALSASLIEGELFGHEKGAFTGADEDRFGAFESCDGGTLFLDEIGELPLALQPKLLRVLEARAIRRIGGAREIPVDVRVIAATHRNLREMVARGEFREDLYHRLMVLDIAIPRLADRPEDILALARHFLASGDDTRRFTVDAEEALLAHPWTGNVRELRNVVLRALVMTDAAEIDATALELSPLAREKTREVEPLTLCTKDQRSKFVRLLHECGNNRAEVARRLGVPKSTLHAQLRRAGLDLKFARS